MIDLMKILFFFLLFHSCGLLEEKQETFEGSYYIVEGWSAFVNEDYQLAESSFLDAMQSGDIRDSILSNIGLGITSFYWANSKINNQSDSTLEIEELRSFASIKFL